ncbi:unnamed protein product [Urochloa decumbens]|uniref:Uncharacterized protein n=1 Tax=Urochloa decumbens TaxID=240449 RepID=A0ABC9EJ62_9POAL
MRQAPPHMVPWTEEEDATLNLKAMVDMCTGSGSGRWCPAGSGSSAASAGPTTCAPTSTSWTEADDLKLITAHKVFGNRWSLIARELDGRSENSVKNHWNATKRSLKAKRRLKKKKNAEAPLGQQWSILEQYIRSISPEAGAAAAAATVTVGDPAEPAVASDSPPSSYDTGYDGEVVSPPAPAVAAPPPHAAGFDPTAMGLYLNASGNNYSSSAAAAAGMGGAADDADDGPGPTAPRCCCFLHPFVDNLAWNNNPAPPVYADAAYASNNNANAAGHYPYYYGGDAGAGPSGTAFAAGGVNVDDVDVVQMASREFQMTPSEDEVTLNLAGFM